MSNRLMGLVLLLVIILAGIGFYVYSFVTYTGTVIINTNVEGFNVQLENIKTLKPIATDCVEKKCELQKIPPFEYKLLVTKEGYKDYEETISVNRSEIKSVVFVLDKDTKLNLVNPVIKEVATIKSQTDSLTEVKLDKKEIILTKEEKLERLRNKKLYYSYFEISNFGEVYFKKDITKMNVYYKDELGKERRITFFNSIVGKSEIGVEKIYGDNSQILIKYGEGLFLYDSREGSFDLLSLKVPIRYVKSGFGRSLQFVTEKGTFIYKNREFEYRAMFEDFVYKDGTHIGIVSANDIRRKKNLGFDEEGGTLVVSQNPETKEKRILLKPSFEVNKILIQSDDVILSDSAGKEYMLENY